MKHTDGILRQMKDAKPFRTLSKEDLIKNMKQASEEMDRQIPPKQRLLMGAIEYEKHKSNPIEYMTSLCNSVWV